MQRFFVRCIISIAWRTSKTFQYGSSQKIDFFFHMGANQLSLGIGWLPGPFPNTTSRSLTISKTLLPVRCIGFVQWSACPLKCLPFLRTWCLTGRNRRWPMSTHFLQWVNHILSVSSKQCVHALYPLFDCPDRLLADQSLMVTNNNARRLKSSCLYSSHIRTPSSRHSNNSSSTNGLSTHRCHFRAALGPG